jgi:pimeloyl-ACP methyl ester carboxylesterase
MTSRRSATAAVAAVAAVLLTQAVGRPACAQPTIAAPAKTFDVGNLHVERFGHGSPALILIPGLSMGAWTWTGQIATFSSDHTVYAVTIDGFDGTPIAPPPIISKADAAILALVKQEDLVKPILIGHSLGGHLALRLVEEHSDLFSCAVLVDVMPYFPPPTAGQSDQQRAQGIQQLADGIQSAPDWLYEEQMRSAIAGLVTDSHEADVVTQHSLSSDRATLAAATTEMSMEDLRPKLGDIAVPVLVVAPVSSQAPYMNQTLRALTPDQLTTTVRAWYAGQYIGAKTVTVETIANSKHFIMLDQPDALNAAIKTFLSTLAPAEKP